MRRHSLLHWLFPLQYTLTLLEYFNGVCEVSLHEPVPYRYCTCTVVRRVGRLGPLSLLNCDLISPQPQVQTVGCLYLPPQLFHPFSRARNAQVSAGLTHGVTLFTVSHGLTAMAPCGNSGW